MKPRLNGDAGAVACTLHTHFTVTQTHSPPLAPSSNVQQRNKTPIRNKTAVHAHTRGHGHRSHETQTSGIGHSIQQHLPRATSGAVKATPIWGEEPLHAGMQVTHLNPVVLLPGVRSGSGPSCTFFRRGTWADGALARGAGRSKSAGAELECSPMGGVE
jgi:hypothetical protein